ncbi:MAG: hypothetical protein ACI4O3_07380 [Oscillospiraceae bacterium]
MKKMMRRMAAAILAAAVMLTLLAGCGAESSVKDTISEFESACHALDVRGMLECVDPTVSKPVLSALNLLGVENTSETLTDLIGVLGIFGDADRVTQEFIQSIHIVPNDYAFNADKDECSVVAALSYGDDNSETITIQMVCKEDAWYISNFDF